MEKKLLELIKLVDKLAYSQDKIYAEITYVSNNTKSLSIDIRDKKEYTYIERIEMFWSDISIDRLDNLIKLFEEYIGDN